MKSFNPIKQLFFILSIILLLAGCDKKIITPSQRESLGDRSFFLKSDDSNRFSYRIGDTLSFRQLKSNTNNKLIYIVNSIEIDTLYTRRFFNDYKSWFDYYEECYHINFTNLSTDSMDLDLYQLGENSIKHHEYSIYLTFNKTFYRGSFKPTYDSIIINNHKYYDVLTALQGEVGDIPKSSHILVNYNDGILRIRATNDEIWDLER